MQSLVDLVDNSKTDKNTDHSYLPVYDALFRSKKYAKINILEIGIYAGGSIKLWHDYFTNGHVYGIDTVNRIYHFYPSLCNNANVTLFFADAYNEQFVTDNLQQYKFDFIIDDGPHTLDSMIFCLQHYCNLLTDDGVLIIEDIQSYDWIDKLKEATAVEFKEYIKVIDLRQEKNRYDDILFIIDKSHKNISSNNNT